MPYHGSFVSSILGKPIVACDRIGTAGTLADLVATGPRELYPKIDRIEICTGNGNVSVSCDAVVDLTSDPIVLKPATVIQPQNEEPDALYFIKQLFEVNLVDLDRRKVMHVKDIEFAYIDGAPCVVAAHAGLTDILPRLKTDRPAHKIFERVPAPMIPWNDIPRAGAGLSEAGTRDVLNLAAYPRNTAGRLMRFDYLWTSSEATVGSAIATLPEGFFETEIAPDVYVVDERERLEGVLSLRSLILAAPGLKIAGMMERNVVRMSPEATASEISSLGAREGATSYPVIDEIGRLLGIVRVDDANQRTCGATA